jgi:methylenetetrahydrofolate dehydrogenase (NADP+)/methenyltetrahydrofolate cyclohydrolase
MYSEKVTFDKNVTTTDIQNTIMSLNIRSDIHGILLQLPLPNTFDSSKLIEMIDSRKDVDGLHPLNVGKLLLNEKGFIPCTPKGIIELLDHYQINIEGKSAVVIGRSNIVGKPLGMLLLNRNATVTFCHSRTRNLNQYTKKAEIIVAAVGIPKFIKRDMISEGAVIVDVGINRIGKKIIGDVDYDGVVDSVSFITPVPGGVGPMTIAMLLRNTLLAAEESFDNS